MPNEKDREDNAFLTEVCWHYYINEMTQAEIATALGMTRLRVNQAIQRAKQEGVIKFHIESPFLPRQELQQELEQHFGLKRALVASANPQNHDFHRPVGAALATFLTEQIAQNGWTKIGVSWGMTLQSAINHMARSTFPDLEIISMIGGTSQGAVFNSFGIASGFAERLGAKYSLLAAPIFLSEGVDLETFLSQDLFKRHFEKFAELDAAILTASNISQKSYLISAGLPSGEFVDELIRQGAIGDTVGRFLDANGALVQNALNSRTIGIDLETLKSVKDRILVAAGEHKVEIIRAAINHGLVNTLITDDITARHLLARP